MKKALLLTIFLGCTALLAGNTYRVELYKPITVNGTELKAGDCKIELLDNKVVFKQGKKTAELPATIENGSQKYVSTTLLTGEGNQPQEIRLSGTTTKITFEKGAVAKSGTGASGAN